MKILVSHFGRQYCLELLKVLCINNWLVCFYTSIAGNKFKVLNRIPKVRNALRKRRFDGIPVDKMVHYPLLFFLERLCRGPFPKLAEYFIRCFDRRVATNLQHHSHELVISYENANLESFKSAKQLGKVTILDLAQIHHQDIVEYAQWFMSPRALQNEIQRVNPRKAEALQYTDYVLTLSEFAAKSMLQNGWPAERLFTVNLGIDPRQFTPKRQAPRKGKLKLLFVGTMTRRKGLDILFQAMTPLPAEQVELTLIGPMADASDLLRHHVQRHTYLPFLHHDDLVQHYQEADVFVFPSLLDSWAQTVLEAMACGTPAIVTENTGAKDAVRQGGGWLIPANDVGALINAIQYCCDHPEDILAKGQQAHQIAQQYTWERYHDQLATILTEIARRENLPI